MAATWLRCGRGLSVVAVALGAMACGSDATTAGGASTTTNPTGGGSTTTTAAGGGGNGGTGGTSAGGNGGTGGTTTGGGAGGVMTGGGGTGGMASGGGGTGGVMTGGGGIGGVMTGGGGTGGTGGMASGGGGTGGAPTCSSARMCDDGMYCNGQEDCIQGECVAGSSPCDDGVSCTIDMCDEAADSCAHMATDALCDNGVACDGAEVCNPILGCTSMGVICDDGILCTTDICDPQTGACLHLPSDALCSDNQFCNGLEQCDPMTGDPTTGCVAGAMVQCSDGIPCTMDSCNEMTDGCDHAATNAACNDNQFCNGAEVCTPGVGCQPGQMVNCSDGLSCTVDACDNGLGACTHTPNNAACNDGLDCNGMETCSASGAAPSGCVVGTPIPCAPDAVPCTVDACNETTNQCEHTPTNGLCPMGQFCVVAAGGCSAAPPCQMNADCDDGNVCNGVETCNVVCQPGTPVTCEDNVACTEDTCNPVTGACSHTPFPGFCDDGLACNGTETCNPAAGGCAPGQQPDCDDGILCTLDTCAEPAGTCGHTPQDFLCGDGNVCNGNEVCTLTGCQMGAAFACPSDGIACTTEVCDPVVNACTSVGDDSLCPCGQTCSPTQGCGSFCAVSTCQGKVYACGDCLDNDGDCDIDSADTQCLGPCDNTEDSFYGGIPGQNNSPCKSDCYFDQDTGSGNDDCYWSHKCDPLEVAPDYPPEGSQCAYNPNANIPGYNGSCQDAFDAQSATCEAYCGPLTPNGCDCFGCCEIPGAPTTVWLGSENPSGTGSCTLANVTDPQLCKPCTQVAACLNTCDLCEICVGKPTLPPECGGVQECPGDLQECGQPDQPPCSQGFTCITGCCQANPQ
jgi:hypothetical protein